MLVSSGVAGFCTKIVLRTSRRPRSVLDRLAGAACWQIISGALLESEVAYCA